MFLAAFMGSVAVLLLPILFTAPVILAYVRFKGFLEWLAASAVIGLTLFTAMSYPISLLYKEITWKSVSLPLLPMGLLGGYYYWRNRKNILKFIDARLRASLWKKDQESKIIVAVILGFLGLLICISMQRLFFIRNDGYHVGFRNNFGDLGLHLHIMTSWLLGKNFPPECPFFSGIPLRYPYLTDYYSTLYWFATGSLKASLAVPGTVFGWAFIVFMYEFGRRLQLPRLAACLIPLVFFLGGSMGWVVWVKEYFFGKEDFFGKTYSMNNSLGLQWPNMLDTLIIPQRGLQWGFPLFLFLLTQCIAAAQKKDKNLFLLLAIVAAPLPFVHGHTLIVLAVFTLFLIIEFPSKAWAYLLIPVGICWLPQVLFLGDVIGGKAPNVEPLIKFKGGWYWQGFEFVPFWTKNLGAFLFVVAWGFYRFAHEKKRFNVLLLMTFASLMIFLLGNVVQFAYWEWDNMKLFAYAFLGLLPMFAYAVSTLLNSRQWWFPVLGSVLIFTQIWCGILDLGHALRPNRPNDFLIFNRQDLAMADWINEHTPRNAVFLMSPTYNQPLLFSGRKVFMGYEGHIWSHGLPLNARKAQINIMRMGLPQAAEAMERNGITHVIYGWREREAGFNLDYFEKNFDVIFDNQAFKIFRKKAKEKEPPAPSAPTLERL